MRHELAYILGQMQNPAACDVLVAVLDDETEDLLVRHESAEALGAIGQSESLPILIKYSTHHAPEIAETCQIAIDLISWNVDNAHSTDTSKKSLYLSHDPAPPLSSSDSQSIEALLSVLMDTSQRLFVRYQAMFSLRDKNSDAAALALVHGFDDSSALFRHEIAFVLGQMQRKASAPGLIATLSKESEHRMVRHEAAEALGAIGGPDIEAILQRYRAGDKDDIVVESCEVALDAMNYWDTNFGESREVEPV